MGSPFDQFDIGTALEMTDSITLKLGRQLPGIPLQLSSATPHPNEPIFILGYPDLTIGRVDLGVEDSNGWSLRVSVGVASEVQGFYRDGVLTRVLRTPDAIRAYCDQQLFVDVDATSGLSGGPMLNAKGEVVGLYTTHFPDRADLQNRYYPEGGRGVGLNFLNRIMNCRP